MVLRYRRSHDGRRPGCDRLAGVAAAGEAEALHAEQAAGGLPLRETRMALHRPQGVAGGGVNKVVQEPRAVGLFREFKALAA